MWKRTIRIGRPALVWLLVTMLLLDTALACRWRKRCCNPCCEPAPCAVDCCGSLAAGEPSLGEPPLVEIEPQQPRLLPQADEPSASPREPAPAETSPPALPAEATPSEPAPPEPPIRPRQPQPPARRPDDFDDLFPPAAPPANPARPAPARPAVPPPSLDEDDPFAPPAPAAPAVRSGDLQPPIIEDDDPFAPPTRTPAAPLRPIRPASEDDPFAISADGTLQMRDWTDDTGLFRTRGRLIAVLEGKVRILKETGRTTTVPMTRLSAEDRAYVEQLLVRYGSDLAVKLAAR